METMLTADAVHYVTREGNDYNIRFVDKQTPLRNTWFIFEVKDISKRTVTEQGISFGRQFVKIIEDKEGVSDKNMCELALLRLKIALERKEEDTTANRPRPTLDCGYDLHSAASVDKPVSMKAETSQFQKMLRRAHRNISEPVVAPRLVQLRYGGTRRVHRWGCI
ncbi:MAG: hypothetical protein NT105_08245 [Verrucomicrobia bacterium]|nr:hypothetical protein [Verrucomicrobiota bacterium]